jgi:hypothetical protein
MVLAPEPGATVGLGGLEVSIRFPDGESVAPETLRVLLNGADVTGELTRGENGAYGWLYELLEGENVLRIEVFGRSPWLPSTLFEQTREVHVRMRPRPDLQRG